MAQKLELLLKSKYAKFQMCKQASTLASFFVEWWWWWWNFFLFLRFFFWSFFLAKQKSTDVIDPWSTSFFGAAIDLVYTWAGNCSQATTSCSLVGNLQQRSSFVEVMAYLEQLRHVAGWLAKGNLWPDWEQESYPEFRDLALIPVFAVLFPTARFFLDKFVFEVCIPKSWVVVFVFFSPHT